MQQLDYEKLVEEALLSAVCKIFKMIEKEGLSEPHHLYITFLTHYPGVQLPAYLLKDYPEEMTVVLQYQFWDLKVTQEKFSVMLSFDDQDEAIQIPFKALVSVVDPSCDFSLDFNPKLPEKPLTSSAKASIASEKGKESLGGNNVVSLDRFRKK